jgi:hypothetical protein
MFASLLSLKSRLLGFGITSLYIEWEYPFKI